jgi:MFS family permease
MQSSYRWLIVALGGLMGCIAIGSMFSLAVFLGPISAATGWSRAVISSTMTLNFLVLGVAGFAWGAISDRVGARIVVLIGAVMLGTGLWLASHATSPLLFMSSAAIALAAAAVSATVPPLPGGERKAATA